MIYKGEEIPVIRIELWRHKMEKENAAEEASESKGNFVAEGTGDPSGGQINERFAGFRARKDEMHKSDGKNK